MTLRRAMREQSTEQIGRSRPPLTSIMIREASESDLRGIARVGEAAFSGMRPSGKAALWVRTCWRASPRMRYWVALLGRKVVGYILWMEKGGFRKDVVLELEQIAVERSRRGRGIGELLIRTSLEGEQSRIERRGSRLKLVEVTTGSEQGALGFYRRSIGAKPVAKIPDLFRGDEYVLIARMGEKRKDKPAIRG